MAVPGAVDPTNGYCSETKTFRSLRPPVSLPPADEPLSIAEYAISLLRSPATAAADTFIIDAATDRKLSYSDFLRRTRALAGAIRSRFPSLARNDVAFVLSPTSLDVPVLYFALLSLGVVVSPANPLSTRSELAHMVRLSKPAVAFATSATSNKLPSLPLGTVILDSADFSAMLEGPTSHHDDSPDRRLVRQSDTATVLYSSGTTGRVKGVELTHRNFIALVATLYNSKFTDGNSTAPQEEAVALLMLPLFHVFGFFMLIRTVSMGETAVIMGRFDFEKMLAAVQKYRVTYIPVSPPLVVALAKSDLVAKYDLSSVKLLACGGAPLGREVAERFHARFPNVDISQGYGLTETTGGTTGMINSEECQKHGSAGRIISTVEAKIVDPETGEALPPGHRGELWLRGPLIMKGYVGDGSATSATLDSEGWLRTGDLCYFDSEGFLFVVDRLKELIKYKAYQVPPAELEHLLQSIPDVADAAVIPFPDEEAGQIPMAYVVRKPGSNITEAQIMDTVAKQVAPYKRIRRISFISAIPKSPAGKILRRELVALAVSAASSKL
nr:4-coumarate--CoA ligase-like 9 [Ipomoea trifida]